MLSQLNCYVAYNASDSLSKTAFRIFVNLEAKTEIKAYHLEQLNLREVTIQT